MKDHKNLRRLYEQEQPAAPTHVAHPPQPMPEFQPQEEPLALPAEGQTSQGVDPMTMVVRDFIAKCKEIDPLVCLGIESFIEKNKDAFSSDAQPTDHSADVNFSNVVDQPVQNTPQPAQNFSLDQAPQELNFPG